MCVLNGKDLNALNLGDSGFLIVRFDGLTGEPYVLIRSKEQTHGFNTPYQLTKLPGQCEVESLKRQGKHKELDNLRRAIKQDRFCRDTPEDADSYQLRARKGDLIILASDGLFDNLFEQQILNIVATTTQMH